MVLEQRIKQEKELLKLDMAKLADQLCQSIDSIWKHIDNPDATGLDELKTVGGIASRIDKRCGVITGMVSAREAARWEAEKGE